MKRKQEKSNSNWFSLFFQNGLNKWIFILSIPMLSLIYSYFYFIPDYKIFPGDCRVYGYTDEGNGGKSVILNQQVSDSLIRMNFELKAGFQSPYVGMTLVPGNDSMINLAKYNQMVLDIRAESVKNVDITLYTRNPDQTMVSKELCFYRSIEVSSHSKINIFNLEELKIPDWWKQVNNIPQHQDIQPDLKHTLRLNIGNAYPQVLNSPSALCIYSITLRRDNRHVLYILMILEVLIILFLVGRCLWLTRKKIQRLPITISYQPVDLKTHTKDESSFLDYINSNFQNEDLSLELVSENTGSSQRKITLTIQEKFQCNFKTYINRIRINESRRLLKTTTLNIGEIAFKVGFSNQTHYNRVFKQLEGMNPSEYRDRK